MAMATTERPRTGKLPDAANVKIPWYIAPINRPGLTRFFSLLTVPVIVPVVAAGAWLAYVYKVDQRRNRGN